MALDDKTKSFICRIYDNKTYPTIKGLAKAAGVSTRTVNRVLVATGRATKQLAAQDEARAFLKVLLKHGIESPKALDQALNEWAAGQGRLDFAEPTHQPTPQQELNLEKVQAFLNKSSVQELAGLFYTSGLMKIAEIHNTSVVNGSTKPNKKVSYAPQRAYKQA